MFPRNNERGHMRRSSRVLLASGAAAITFLALSSQIALAAAPVVHASFARISSTTTLPNSNVKDKGGSTVFKPDSLTTVWSGSSEAKCTTSKHEITITNKTTQLQQVTYNGSTLGTLPAGTKGGICFWGTGSETFSFGLTGSTSQLSVSVT
jgi:hypothetical protein